MFRLAFSRSPNDLSSESDFRRAIVRLVADYDYRSTDHSIQDIGSALEISKTPRISGAITWREGAGRSARRSRVRVREPGQLVSVELLAKLQ